MPVKIFCCYAHEDEALLKKLKTHLRPLQRQGLVDVWYDRDISAGTHWEQQIKAQLDTAQIILLLVSPDFMDSDNCYGIEMQRALERHERGEARVIPVIVRPVYWQGVLGQLQALPTDAKAVMSSLWHNVDEAFYDVTQGLHKVVTELMPTPSPPPPSPALPGQTSLSISALIPAPSKCSTGLFAKYCDTKYNCRLLKPNPLRIIATVAVPTHAVFDCLGLGHLATLQGRFLGRHLPLSPGGRAVH